MIVESDYDLCGLGIAHSDDKLYGTLILAKIDSIKEQKPEGVQDYWSINGLGLYGEPDVTDDLFSWPDQDFLSGLEWPPILLNFGVSGASERGIGALHINFSSFSTPNIGIEAFTNGEEVFQWSMRFPGEVAQINEFWLDNKLMRVELLERR